MKVWYKDFIGVYEKAVPKEWCNLVIKIFEKNPKNQISRLESEGAFFHQKKDLHLVKDTVSFETQKPLLNLLQNIILPNYNSYYCFNSGHESNFYIDDFKVQKTSPSEGYHLWHWENNGNIEVINRLFAWTVYLNDIKKGGETEFLYQSLRIPPKQGTVCIFPATFTHTHRGNPPLKNSKYIVTGWVNYLQK